MSDDFVEDDEVLMKEIVFTSKGQVSDDPFPSQWTLTQRDDRSPSFPLPRRKERVQHERIGFNSPQSGSDNSLSHENDFANLEALLEDQQRVGANCTKNDASITEKDDGPTVSRAKRPITDPEVNPLPRPDNLGRTSNDTEHSFTRQSTVRSQGETGASGPSQTTSNANRSYLVDRAPRRLQSSYSNGMISSLFDSTSQNHSSILEKSRKMAAQSQQQHPPRIIQDRRSNSTLGSIAGPRPTHWDQRDPAASNKRRSRSVDPISKKSRATMLSTFTQHSIDGARLPSSRKQFVTPARQQVPNFPTPGMLQCQDPIVDDIEQDKPKETAEPTRNSFAPSFLSSSSSPAPNSNSVITSPGVQSPQLQPSLGGRGKKSKALFSGRLCKRLQSIRDTIRGDKIRFQSGQYPFSIVSLDMNDPRNRATSVLDITLVETSGMSNRDSQKVLMLGFVHHATGGLSHLISQHAWVCLACDTARELAIVNGSQLRIYNAVSMESTTPMCGSVSSNLPTVKWTILATTLCESYPTLLPKLPHAPAGPSL